jgi:adenine phosphoribosyltransferase
VSEIASRIVARFRWVQGHADVWALFTDPILFRDVVRALAEPFRDSGVTKVAGVEARGFLVGGAVAAELEAGFVAIRKQAGLFPGEKLTRQTSTDYRGNRSQLRLQRASVTPTDRVLLVDDWFETGSQASAAKALIEETGATFVGASVIVDQLPPDARRELGTFVALIHSDSLGSSLEAETDG